MARIVIISDHDPKVSVELRRQEIGENLVVEVMEWAGSCAGPGCTWQLAGSSEAQIGAPGSAQPYDLADVIETVSEHVDGHPVPHPVVRRLARLANDLEVWFCPDESRQIQTLAADVSRGRVPYADAPATLRALPMHGDAAELVDRALDDVDDLAGSS